MAEQDDVVGSNQGEAGSEEPVPIMQQLLGKKLDEWFSVHFRTQDARLHGKLG